MGFLVVTTRPSVWGVLHISVCEYFKLDVANYSLTIRVDVPVNQSDSLQINLVMRFFIGVLAGGPALRAIWARLSAPSNVEQLTSSRIEQAWVPFTWFVLSSEDDTLVLVSICFLKHF